MKIPTVDLEKLIPALRNASPDRNTYSATGPEQWGFQQAVEAIAEMFRADGAAEFAEVFLTRLRS